MPLDLNLNKGPINKDNPEYQDVLEDLQGNILKGHGRDKSVHIFLTFPNPQENPQQIDALKNWIAQLAINEITSAKKQLDEAKLWKEQKINGETFVHFALSSSGYSKLGFSNFVHPKGANLQKRTPDSDQYEQAFQQGMKLRQNVLLDQPSSFWDSNFRNEIDALIVIANNNPEVLNQKRVELEISLKDITTNIFNEQGDTLRQDFNGKKLVVEHFGYADGISQPNFFKENENSGSNFSPDAPLNLVLIPDPFGKSGVSFGSFLVFRKLEQNVRGFKKAESALSQELGIPFKLAGAMAVGRFEDGTPLVLQPNDGGVPGLNDFNYRGDSEGLRCPFQAHIRKSNPRLESVKKGGLFAQSEEQELGHRIARRGVTYGGPLSDFSENVNSLPERGVGLLFICYQSDIWEQFEFMQRFWCNNPRFLEPDINNNPRFLEPDMKNHPNYDRTGLDAVVGQRYGNQEDPLIEEVPQPPKNWPNSYGQGTDKPDIAPENEFGQFVTLKGGEYFFSPSLTFLKNSNNQIYSDETTEPTPGKFYIVKDNDTLFKIAQRAYDDGNYNLEIYQGNRDKIGEDPNSIFSGQKLFIPILNSVFFKAKANSKYVSAWLNDKNAPLIAQVSHIKEWEKFKLIEMDDGSIALKAANGKYVSAWLNDKNAPLIAQASHIKEWEKFKLIEMDDGSIALKAANGKYVSAWLNDKNAPLTAQASHIKEWEKFKCESLSMTSKSS